MCLLKTLVKTELVSACGWFDILDNVQIQGIILFDIIHLIEMFSDPDQGLCDGVCERHHVLQGEGRHQRRS